MVENKVVLPELSEVGYICTKHFVSGFPTDERPDPTVHAIPVSNMAAGKEDGTQHLKTSPSVPSTTTLMSSNLNKTRNTTDDVNHISLLNEHSYPPVGPVSFTADSGIMPHQPVGYIKVASDVLGQLQSIGSTQALGSNAEVIDFLIQQYQKMSSSQHVDWCEKCGGKEITLTCVACGHLWCFSVCGVSEIEESMEGRQVLKQHFQDQDKKTNTGVCMPPALPEEGEQFLAECQIYPSSAFSLSDQSVAISSQGVEQGSGDGLATSTCGVVSRQISDSQDAQRHKPYFNMTTIIAAKTSANRCTTPSSSYGFCDKADISGGNIVDRGSASFQETHKNLVTSLDTIPHIANRTVANSGQATLPQAEMSSLSTEMVLENLAVSTACGLIGEQGGISDRWAETALSSHAGSVNSKSENENSKASGQINDTGKDESDVAEQGRPPNRIQHQQYSKMSCKTQVRRRRPSVGQSQSQAETETKVKRPFLCEVCGFANLTKVAFRRHLMIHTGEKPFLCQQCGDSFKDAWGLKKHVSKIHSRNKLYNCRICTDVFLSPRCLHLHLETVHSDRKTYRCQVCGKALATAKSLRRHKRIHSGEKPYECPHCDRAFNNSSGRVAHMKLHQDPSSVLYIPSAANPL